MKNKTNHARHLWGLASALVGLVIGFAVPLASTTGAASVQRSSPASTSTAVSKENAEILNRWSSNGPDGGQVLSLAIDRTNPATIYAATASGVFKSTNGGESWSSSLTNTYVQIVAIAPTTPSTLYAASRTGVYRTTDGGTSWHAMNNGLTNQYGYAYVIALAVDPANSNVIYAGGLDTGVSGGYPNIIYKSTNGGASWSVSRSAGPYTEINTLVVDPTNANTIYAGGAIGAAGTVFKTTDGGRSWSEAYLGFNSGYIVRALSVDPSSPSTILAGNGYGVYKSNDGGLRWSAFNDGLQIPSDPNYFWGVNSLAIDPGNPRIVYAATSGGVFKSSNGGSWSALNGGLSNLSTNALAIDPGNPSVFYAGTDDGIFKTIDSGATLTAAKDGLHAVNIGLLAINPVNARMIYAAADRGPYKSADNGGSWTRGDFYPLAFDPHNPNTIYARVSGSDALSKSTDGGATWNSINPGSPYVSLVVIDPNNSNVIYAVTDGLYKSSDAGGSWSAVGNILYFYPSSLVIDPSNSQTLYAIYNDCYTTTVYKSADGGATWIKSDGNGSTFFDGASALAIDSINTTTLYISACTYGVNTCGIYKTIDGGESWNRTGAELRNGGVSSLVIDPARPNVIYAGMFGYGVYKSTDSGASWNPLNDGLTNLNINALAMDASGSFLHAGTSTGVFDIQLSIPPQGNQIDEAQFFVRQHYLDFLNREPDAGGLAYWTDRITQCGPDVRCISERRIAVSAAFFIELEFQETGYFVDRLYKASFGRQPNYSEFTFDRSKVIGGSNLEANKQAFADEWVQRHDFVAAYPITMSNTEVVNKLFDSAGLTASIFDLQRQQEIQAINAGRSRALVLRDVIEIPDFKNIPNPNDPRYSEIKQTSQYNPAFVLMQYFGYLRRDVDRDGYDFWLDVVNNREPNNYHGMVCSFITSTEYQLRFGSVVTRSNADCGQ